MFPFLSNWNMLSCCLHLHCHCGQKVCYWGHTNRLTSSLCRFLPLSCSLAWSLADMTNSAIVHCKLTLSLPPWLTSAMANPKVSTILTPAHLCFLSCYCPQCESLPIRYMYTHCLIEWILCKSLPVSSHDHALKFNQIFCCQEVSWKISHSSSHPSIHPLIHTFRQIYLLTWIHIPTHILYLHAYILA